MSLVTRRPTGRPSWPILLLAGGEKQGKSYAAAAASASEHVGRTLWWAIGEDEPDELGLVPGADFEIVQHDGTYRGLLGSMTAALSEPTVDGKPTLLVLDSGSRLWGLLTDMAQVEANARAARKAEKYKRSAPEDDVTIGMDLWNSAKDRWTHVVDVLRAHQGPSIITARLEIVAVVNEKGDPTGAKERKVVGHKSLPFDAGAIAYVEGPAGAEIGGVRSLSMKAGRRQPFSVEGLWREMGVLDDAGERTHQDLRTEVDWGRLIEDATDRDALTALWADAADSPNCDAIREAITARAHELQGTPTDEPKTEESQ